MSSSNYNPVKKTLGDVLSSTTPPIRVPEYQRDFSWQAKHVADFWDDLIDFDKKLGTAAGTESYFLGTVVLVLDGDNHLVLDGQQRFATATILLAVIRDKLKTLDPQASDYIQSHFIAFEDRLNPTRQRLYKVELNVYDRDFFRRAVQDEGFSEKLRPSRRSHKLILDARRRLQAFLDAVLSGDKTDEAKKQRLLRLSASLTQRFGVVAITSDDEDQAASIFETLNERGIGLSTADLLRSWIMSNARPSTRPEIVKLWDQIGESQGERRVEVVIRTSWVSSHGDVKTRALYREIKDHLKEAKISPVEYSRALAADAAFLKQLARGSTDLETVNDAALDLIDVQAPAAFAAMLAAHNVLDPRDCCILARALINLALRHHVICGLEKGRFEAAVLECARIISTQRDLEAGLQALRDCSPTNEELRLKFRRIAFPPKRSKAAQVVLRAIEAGRHRTGETRVARRMKVHLEHIYPQRPPKRSNHHDKIVYLLGNLTLLGGNLNRQASNSLYAKKKKSYSSSELLITKEIPVKYGRWGRGPILERQRRLLEELVRICPQCLVN